MVERCVRSPDYGLVWGVCADDVCTPGEAYTCEREPEDENLDPPKFYYCLVDELGVASADSDVCFVDEVTTPLLLAFDDHEPAFRLPLGGAEFDVDGRGRCTTPDWPTASTPWLARDLDRSGSIDGGHELFGNGTLLASGRYAEHGFAALAELDEDGDGLITAADPAWPELLLWADVDGDRRTDAWELLPLAAVGVDSLSLEFQVDPRCDPRGNCWREQASFTRAQSAGAQTMSGQHRPPAGRVLDVYLACL